MLYGMFLQLWKMYYVSIRYILRFVGSVMCYLIFLSSRANVLCVMNMC